MYILEQCFNLLHVKSDCKYTISQGQLSYHVQKKINLFYRFDKTSWQQSYHLIKNELFVVFFPNPLTSHFIENIVGSQPTHRSYCIFFSLTPPPLLKSTGSFLLPYLNYLNNCLPGTWIVSAASYQAQSAEYGPRQDKILFKGNILCLKII